MAGMTDLAIRIATTLDSTGLNKADKGVNKLSSTVKKLGRTLGLTLGAAAMTAYGKAAVKAFAADQAAAQRLAGAVDNLGLSFSQAKVTTFIAELEQSAAIADDILRPAFQSLLTTTGSLTKSQELLNNAIQISRASGVDLATVATDLGKGYVGITRGLTKYNTGLTRAEITTKSFNEILGIMLARSAGAAQDYLTTTSYKMEVLSVAAGNAQEIIGEGLVDAFARIGGGTEASDAAKAINNIAKATSRVIVALGTAIGYVEKFRQGYTNFIAGGDVNVMLKGANPSTNRSASPAGTAQRTAQQRTAEIAAAKRAKELVALQTKQTKSQKALTDEQKKQNALKKAGTIFDLDQIQLIAALKGKLSDEDRKKVELQFALLTGNLAEAKKLSYEIGIAQGLSEKLAGYLASLPDAKNPFASWEAYLDMLAKKAALIVTGDPNFNSSLGWNNNPSFPEIPDVPVQTNVTPFPRSTPGSFRRAEEASNLTGPIQVTVQIDGKAVASSLQDSSLSGIGSSVNRTGR
jgi:hypothetical protein